LARTAAIQLSGNIDEGSLRVLLLSDIRTIFSRSRSRVSSWFMCDELACLENRPWATHDHGRQINQNDLAYLLRDFNIVPQDVRVLEARDKTETVRKGYKAEAFADAFKRYLPVIPPDQSATPLQPYGHKGKTRSAPPKKSRYKGRSKALQKGDLNGKP